MLLMAVYKYARALNNAKWQMIGFGSRVVGGCRYGWTKKEPEEN